MSRINVPAYKYDADIKSNYLNQLLSEGYSDSQYNVAASFLYRVSEYEYRCGMPCYKYSSEGLLDMLSTVNTTSLATLKTFLSTLRCYIIYANDRLNTPLGNVSVVNISSRDLELLINPYSKEDKYITKKEYIDIISIKEKGNKDVNWVDLAQVVLLWNGIKGMDYEDLILIDKTNFKQNSLIYNDKVVTLTPLESKIIKNSFKEEEYTYYDRFNTDGSKREVKLKDNQYLFRASERSNSESERISVNSLKCRLSGLTNTCLRLPSLTGVSIYSSGLVYHALESVNFNPSSVMELDRLINSSGKRLIAYSKLAEISKILIDKISKE